jgi:hypothetical protein
VQVCDLIGFILRPQLSWIVLREFFNHLKPFEARNNPFPLQGILKAMIVLQNRKSSSGRKAQNNSSSG